MNFELVAQAVDVRRVVGAVCIDGVGPSFHGHVLVRELVDLVDGLGCIKPWAIRRNDWIDRRWPFRVR